jgi:surface polysaccharide O-acyltransferase-like enzyme
MNYVKRSPAADIIRILAFILVVSVHFFLNNDFYSQTVAGKRMFIMTLMRSFFIICVPLFITLSGYLLKNKKLKKAIIKELAKLLSHTF